MESGFRTSCRDFRVKSQFVYPVLWYRGNGTIYIMRNANSYLHQNYDVNCTPRQLGHHCFASVGPLYLSMYRLKSLPKTLAVF